MASTGQYPTRKRGPRFKLNPAQQHAAVADYTRNEASVDEIARSYGVTKMTIYNIIKRLRTSGAGNEE